MNGTGTATSFDRSVPFASARFEPLRRVFRAALPVVDWAFARVTLNDDRLEGLATTLDATLSLSRVRARVVDVVLETDDVKTYLLKPNARWRGFRAGAFVTLRLTIDGETVHRSYSVSSSPSNEGLIAITVKRVSGGLVSNWLFNRIKPGDVLELTSPQGQFVLPEIVPQKLLMISAGSGITPVMSMLRHLANAPADIAFLHFARSPGDIIFHRELGEIAESRANTRLSIWVEDGNRDWKGERGRFCERALSEVAADWKERPIYMCGPPAFMEAVLKTLEKAGYDLANLHYERFSADFDVSKLIDTASLVRFQRSGVEAVSSKPRTILEEAEARGLRPEHGCRMGICGACRCTKLSGVVVNATTGQASGNGSEHIYPCISVARGTVEVDL